MLPDVSELAAPNPATQASLLGNGQSSNTESVEIAATSWNCDPAQIAVSLADVTSADHPLDVGDGCLPHRGGNRDRRSGPRRSRSSIFAINMVGDRERGLKIVRCDLAPACG